MLELTSVLMRLAFTLIGMAIQLSLVLIRLVFQILGLILQPLFGPRQPAIPPFRGRAYVIDGDTLAFGKKRVRIFGIDAPEADQEQGPMATKAMRLLVENKDLLISPIERDQYGRIVARVHLSSGKDVASHMVRGGWAIAETKYSHDYVDDMRAAMRDNSGLWAARNGISDPSSFRKAQN